MRVCDSVMDTEVQGCAQRPEWFKQHLSSVKDQYPETKFRIYFIAEGPQWGVKCLTCKDSKVSDYCFVLLMLTERILPSYV